MISMNFKTPIQGQRILFVVFTLFLSCSVQEAESIFCRNTESRDNHIYGLWRDQFPFNGDINNQPSALCDGSVKQSSNGEICVEGRVSYQQIMEAIGNRNFYQPSAPTISLNGHLISGSGNAVFGDKARYIYDFVENYTVNGVSYTANNSNIVDKMLAASRGTIDQVCLRSDFVQPEEWYSISHTVWVFRNVDTNLLRSREDIGLLFFSAFLTLLEFHTPLEQQPFAPIRNFWYNNLMDIYNSLTSIVPGFIYRVLPILSIAGLSRLIFFGGFFSTSRHPNALAALDLIGDFDAVQLDTQWEALVTAIDNGLFSGDSAPPINFNVVIKRIVAVGQNFKCWGEGTIMASIDVEIPGGSGEALDEYIDGKVFPAIQAAGGNLTLHVGKRSPPNSLVLQSTIDFYAACGVETNLTISDSSCYNPICDRTATPRRFKYPDQYYA